MNFRLVFRTLFGIALLLGCGVEGTSDANQELGDHRYSVELSAPAQWVVDQQDFLELQIRPKAGRKLSLEYPTRVEIQEQENLIAPARMDKEAAALLTEAAIDYRVPVEAKATGRVDLEGKLLVGVCTNELCESVELPFETVLSVTAATP